MPSFKSAPGSFKHPPTDKPRRNRVARQPEELEPRTMLSHVPSIFSDDNAIAPDKTAYLPGSGSSVFSAISSYDKGINGIMVDLSGWHGVMMANDFVFKVGNNNSPHLWATAPAPTTVTTRTGAGSGAAIALN